MRLRHAQIGEQERHRLGRHRRAVVGVDGNYSGELEDPCRNVFTDIWDAYYGLPGALQTQ
ncbi:hypothetical protein GCM10009827_109540 [Dactylosporangium maewongense]|uniref:Uncharacterized protein n=1 Tax=Dactylosporangium maewongense TaxID=634393 RepID=A0ABP4NXE4_9ACTN